MRKFKIVAIAVLATILVSLTVQVVVAQTTGIDLIALVQQKAASLSDANAAASAAQLEQTKKDTEQDTLNYVDKYVNDLKQSLDQYTNQQTELAKQQIINKGKEVKNTLDAQKQQVTDSSKVTIKAKIDSDLSSQLDTLQNDLNAQIQNKLK